MAAKPLLITLGDSNGLGPELACLLLGQRTRSRVPALPLLMIGLESALLWHAKHLGITPFWTRITDPAKALGKGIFLLEPEEIASCSFQVGQEHVDGGRAAGVSLHTACKCIQDGIADGLVTLPLHKAMLQEAGFDFPGHTEFLARFAGLRDEDVCMHLCGDTLRVSLVTTHPPLRDVPDLVTYKRILHCLNLTVDFVRQLGKGDIPVAVCGLNPHAGESGKIGTEDRDVVEPAVAAAQLAGLHVEGPFPADTIFYKAARGEYSAVLAMYHDQGLGPLKLLHFSKSVNVTLGLPFVRTSVDHGTGFDIVGTGVADTGSFEEALSLATTLVEGRQSCA